MFLRLLSLRGFKSFADKTTLEFRPGISVIVGPNGSGKSNLVDAISWVLGEQGPRALRGGQMADVIFAGSPGRSALGMAEVKLVIDNSNQQIPVPLTELEISRTIFRSGDSEYRIGGEVRRLLDIQELLAESGIGRALHTVVGQGQLEDVLTARPEERRQYVEEAAGIAKHRRRKERAERKLGGIEQDVLRLQDVLAELRRQLKPLRQQAEVARRHEELTADAEEVARRLAAAKLRKLYRARDSRMSVWERGRSRRDEARGRLEGLDEELRRLAAERARASALLADAEAVHEAATERRSAAERALREAVTREGELRSRLAQLEAAAVRSTAVADELARVERDLAGVVESLDEREAELRSAEEEHRARQAARHQAEEERRLASEETVAHRAQVQTLSRSLEAYDRERDTLDTQLREVRERADSAHAERERLHSEVERLDSEETALAERQARFESVALSLAAEVGELEERLREAERRRDLLEARRSDLSQTPGSRFLEAHSGHALGLLRDFVRPDDGMEHALAAALGSLADAVVYEDEDRALADAVSGEGATLAVAGSNRPAPALPDERPLLGAVDVDRAVAGLMSTLLRDVYLAETAEEAAAGHRKHPHCSFVTPDGILVGAGIVATASVADTRLQALKRELSGAERDVSAAQMALEPRRARLEEATGERDAIRAELDAHDELITEAAEAMSRVAAELVALEREGRLLGERVATLEATASAARETLGRAPRHAGELPPLPPIPEPPMAARVEVEMLRRERSRLDATAARLRREQQSLSRDDRAALAETATRAQEERLEAERALTEAEVSMAEGTRLRTEAIQAERAAVEAEAGANRAWREAAAALELLREEYEDEDRLRSDLERSISEAERLLREGHGIDPGAAVGSLDEEETPESLERRAELVGRRLGLLGRVNLLAEREFSSLEERHDFLARELEDVRKARRDLLELVATVDSEITRLFEESFRDVAAEFSRLFAELFPGGEGRLVLTEPSEPLTTGIELEARPGRKRVKRISLLSGGERALTAMAFLFAIFRARPSPFYLLDEVEAALDDINLHRFLGLVRSFATTSQVLIVTHQKRTMEIADVLYGVSMSRDGSSRVVSQRMEDGAGPSEDGIVRVSDVQAEPARAPDRVG